MVGFRDRPRLGDRRKSESVTYERETDPEAPIASDSGSVVASNDGFEQLNFCGW
jgi:hypothetical protein